MSKAKKISIFVIVIVAAGSIWAISPYFTNTSINEDLPILTSQQMDQEEMTKSSGIFVGVGDGVHDAQGNAMVLSIEDDTRYLRFEDFKSTNGPDLYVYLATDKEATDFVNLGRLKANMGNQNYEIPSEVDLSKYHNVLIWCQAFSVLFGSADLN